MKMRRWVGLDPEIDKELKKIADKENRSIANMLKHIVTKFLDDKK